MMGTYTKTILGVMLAVVSAGAAHAGDRSHDPKLERWMKERAAQRLGDLRGPLKHEWRPATVLEQFAGMSSREISLLGYKTAPGPTMASAPSASSYKVPAYVQSASYSSFREAPKRVSRVIPIYAGMEPPPVVADAAPETVDVTDARGREL